MTHIYALVSGQLILYVGKTVRTLKEREQKHRNNGNNTNSKYIPDYIDWTIRLLETVPDDQAVRKEQQYYDTLKPLYNRCRPGQSRGEYEQSKRRRDGRREANRKYRLKKKSKAPVDETLVS